MGRPVTIATADIVEAARRLILDHGPGVSTALIARELGISEATIYKRFETKEALFQAALGLPDCAFARAWPARAGEGEVRENLVTMARELLRHFRAVVPRMVMLCSKPGWGPAEALRAHDEPPPVVIVGSLTAYLRAEAERGRIGPVDPEASARLLVGALHNTAFIETLGLEGRGPKEEGPWIEAVVGALWQGIAP